MTVELDISPEFDLIARSLVREKKRSGKQTPSAVDLATSLSTLNIDDTISGSSNLELVIFDEDFRLLDSGFFDADRNGYLDAIDLNYPDGSNHWWRLTQTKYTEQQMATMTFMERPAVYMQYHHGPIKAQRGKKTRAQFIQMLVNSVKKNGGIQFVSHDLTVKQPKAKGAKRKTRQTKDKGISFEEAFNLTIGGVHVTAQQIKEVETSLDVAERLKATEKAMLALLADGIAESGFVAKMNTGGSPYGGVFQGNVRGGVWKLHDTAGMAEAALKGGKGFQGGGIIALAHTDMTIGEIVLKVQGSRSNFPSQAAGVNFYGNPGLLKEAQALLQAYGGSSAGGETYTKKYNFQVGGRKHPNENYWDAAVRLAREVNWALFLDGNTVYYDPETTLIRQKPVAVIQRDDPALISWDVTCDNRHIATEMTLDLVCDPMEFRAGEVIRLVGFGPASTISTVKLPGRWLISDVDRDIANVFSSFTLKQPEKQKKEPQDTQGTKRDPTSSVDVTGTPGNIIDNIVVPIAVDLGFEITPESVHAANIAHSHLGSASDHAGPPSQKWAADISDGTAPTPRMDKLARALLKKFDGPVKNMPSPHATSGPHPENLISWNSKDGIYRFQLIYRMNSSQAGNHYNHVHFGVKMLSFQGPPTPTSPPGLDPTPHRRPR